jgi:hypothetical protein
MRSLEDVVNLGFCEFKNKPKKHYKIITKLFIENGTLHKINKYGGKAFKQMKKDSPKFGVGAFTHK